MEKLEGVIVPIVSPLKEDESIDEEGVEQLVNYSIDNGVTAILVLGTTGEFPVLTSANRRRIIELTLNKVNGRVPVLVGTGSTGTKRAIENTREAAKMGAQATLLSPPYFYEMTQRDILAHYLEVLEQVDIPIMVYNVPFHPELEVKPETVRQLLEHPNIVGIKDSSGDFSNFLEILELKNVRGDFTVFQGIEPQLTVSILYGSDGIIAGSVNLVPDLIVRLYTHAKRGEMTQAMQSQRRLNSLGEIYQVGYWLSGLKTSLELKGLCSAYIGKPFPPLDHNQREKIREILVENGIIP
ncbi:dihydrodipicolinate synthase family protein [Candidatus Aerophobetes bacterium]|nr:dihydrodipicolinate synthase family protein [Candidatus Aerophobetes bacterium]